MSEIYILSEVSMTKTIIDINVMGEIDTTGKFELLLTKLYSSKKGDLIRIHLASYGGSSRAGAAIITAIKNAKAHVHIHVFSPTMSMGSVIALSGDSLSLEDNVYLMFHNYYMEFEGKGHELTGQIGNQEQWFQRSFKSRCQPFLTIKECRDMFLGKDLYISTEDDLELRINRHFKRQNEYKTFN